MRPPENLEEYCDISFNTGVNDFHYRVIQFLHIRNPMRYYGEPSKDSTYLLDPGANWYIFKAFPVNLKVFTFDRLRARRLL